MTLQDLFIFTGWLVLESALLFTVALALFNAHNLFYRSFRSEVGWPVVRDAIKEFRKTHPERFKTFDAT